MKTPFGLALLALLFNFGTAHAYQYPGIKTQVAARVWLQSAHVAGGQMIVARAHGRFYTRGDPYTVIEVSPDVQGDKPGDVVDLEVELGVANNVLTANVFRWIISPTGGVAKINYPITDPLMGTLKPDSDGVINIDLWLYVTPNGGWIESVDGPSVLATTYTTPLFFGYGNGGALSPPTGVYSVGFPSSFPDLEAEVYQASPTQMPCAEAPCEPFQYFSDILTEQFADPTPGAPFFHSGQAWRAAALLTAIGS